MHTQAKYNWQIAQEARLRKERIYKLLIGVPCVVTVILFISSVDSIVEYILR